MHRIQGSTQSPRCHQGLPNYQSGSQVAPGTTHLPRCLGGNINIRAKLGGSRLPAPLAWFGRLHSDQDVRRDSARSAPSRLTTSQASMLQFTWPDWKTAKKTKAREKTKTKTWDKVRQDQPSSSKCCSSHDLANKRQIQRQRQIRECEIQWQNDTPILLQMLLSKSFNICPA